MSIHQSWRGLAATVAIYLLVGAQAQAAPIVAGAPNLTPAVSAHVVEIAGTGRRLGNRAAVFAKIGDSITESQSFLGDVGKGYGELGQYDNLQSTISYYRGTVVDRQDGEPVNSFDHASLVATSGWQITDILSSTGRGLLRAELNNLQPGVALIMFGTNDVEHRSARSFARKLRALDGVLSKDGVVAVTSTIPERLDRPGLDRRVAAYNTAIRQLARRSKLPLMDYNLALEPLPNRGVSDDGIHPSILNSADGAVWTDEGLRYGYNVRNLLAVETLHRLRTLVDSAYSS